MTAPEKAVFDFTIFEGDGITPFWGSADTDGEVVEADFQTNDDGTVSPDHERPYLLAPENFSATEIDFVNGTSTIGAVSVGVIDKRLTETDQTSGIVTSRVKETVGKRAVLRRYVPSLGTWIKLFDGVIHKYSVDTDNVLTYWFHVRDGREFERGGELFESNFVLYGEDGRKGPPVDYGELPGGGGYLVPGVGGYQANSTFQVRSDSGDEITWGFIELNDGDNFSPELRKKGFPTVDSEGLYRYNGIKVEWRAKGSNDPWTTVENMPREQPLQAYIPAHQEWSSSFEESLTHDTLYIGSKDATEVPTDGQAIEFRVLAVEITDETPFFWDNGSLGDLLDEIRNGTHSTDTPEERYDDAEITQFGLDSIPARFILREPVTDRRAWVDRNVYAAALVAPAFTDKLELYPVSWKLPTASEVSSIPTIDKDTIEPPGEWEDGIDAAIGCVEYTFIREHLDPLETKIVTDSPSWWKFWADDETKEVVDDDRSTWERLVEEETTVKECSDDAIPGAKTASFAPITVRSIVGAEDAPDSGDTLDNLGNDVANRAAKTILPRFDQGSPRYIVSVAATPENLQLKLGDWVVMPLDWIPDYATGKRGTARYMQIYGISDHEPARRELKLQDGGVSNRDDEVLDDDGIDCIDAPGGSKYASPEGYTQVGFTSSASPLQITNTCGRDVTLRRVVLIGGGGGGGGNGLSTGAAGGGGAGGVKIAENVLIAAGETIQITIGLGGGVNSDGGDTILWVDENGLALDPLTADPADAIRAVGGGAGGSAQEDAGNGGGSGGGGGTGGSTSNSGQAGGGGTGDQGNPGGSGSGLGGGVVCNRGAGGGGGSYAGAGEDGKIQPLDGVTRGGAGGGTSFLEDFAIVAGSGGQGGANQTAGVSAPDSACSNGGGEFTTAGQSGSGFGAGGGGAAGTSAVGKSGSPGYAAVQYAGASIFLDAPDVSSTSVDSDTNAVEICIDEGDWPQADYEEYRVLVEYAVAPTEPDADSGLWKLAGTLDAPGCVKTPALPTGATVWRRTRAEANNMIPSDPGTAGSDETTSKPTLLRRDLTLSRETGIATVTWTANAATDEVEIRAEVHDGSSSPSSPLALIATVDAAVGTYELSTLTVEREEWITVDLVAKEADALSETSSGKLARYIAKDGDDPFDANDWSGHTASVSVDPTTGELIVNNSGSNNTAGRHDALAARSKGMVQAEIQYDAQHSYGLALHVADEDNLVTLRWPMAANKARIDEWNGAGASTSVDTATVPEKFAATHYWGSIVVDGLDYAAYDFDGDAHLSGTGATRNSGKAGISNRDPASGVAQSATRHLYYHEDRYVYVSNLGAGYKAKVLDSGGNVLSEATEVSGQAAVDLIDVKPTESVAIIVTDASDNELARVEPSDGVWGGSQEDFTAASGVESTYRIADERPALTKATPAFVYATLDSLSFDDDLNLDLDDALNPTRDDT